MKTCGTAARIGATDSKTGATRGTRAAGATGSRTCGIAGKIAAMCWKTAAIGGKIGGIGGADRRRQLENLRRHR